MNTLTAEGLAAAEGGSYYTISGCGEPLDEWVAGYEKELKDREIGTPTEWFSASGDSINLYATEKHGVPLRPEDKFKGDLTLLMFPLTGLDVGRLAMFKLQMDDRWFDDVVANMHPSRG